MPAAPSASASRSSSGGCWRPQRGRHAERLAGQLLDDPVVKAGCDHPPLAVGCVHRPLEQLLAVLLGPGMRRAIRQASGI